MEILKSPFTHGAVFSAVLYVIGLIAVDWRNLAIDSLPTVLGFSIAAYTITFSLMGSALHRALSSSIDRIKGISLLTIVNTTFFHVVFFQSLSLLYSYLSKGSGLYIIFIKMNIGKDDALSIYNYANKFGDVLGFTLFMYATFLLLSVAVALYRLGGISQRIANLPSKGPVPANDQPTVNTFGENGIVKTWRFKLLVRIAKAMGLYRV